MKLRSFALLLALCLLPLASHAQVGLYFNPVVIHISNSVADTGVFAFLGNNSKSQNFGGIVFGGYYDFPHTGKLQGGIDVRDMLVHGNNASLNSFLVGARISRSVATSRFQPYLQGDVGVGSTKPPTNPYRINRAQFGAFAGVDYHLGRHLDFRMAEVGYGSVQTVSTATAGAYIGPGIPNARLLSVTTGLVFRIP